MAPSSGLKNKPGEKKGKILVAWLNIILCTLLRNVDKRLPDYMTSQFSREHFQKSCFILIHKPVASTKTSMQSTKNDKVLGHSTKSVTAQSCRNRSLLFSIFSPMMLKGALLRSVGIRVITSLFFCLYVYECQFLLQSGVAVTLPAFGNSRT